MKNNKFSRYLVNRTLATESGKVASKSIFDRSDEAGWYDANVDLYRKDVTGYPHDLGTFDSMRYNHPVIKAAMDFRMNQVNNMRYDVVPRCDEPDEIETVAANAVQHVIENMPYQNLCTLVSFVYDQVSTYGFCFYEWIWDENDLEFSLFHIPPSTIDRIELSEDFRYINCIYQNNGGDYIEIEADRLIWFGKDSTLGNYFGRSDLRSLLMYFEAQQQAMQHYLRNQENSVGVVYLQQTDTVPDEESFLEGLQWLRDVSIPFIAPEQLKPQYLQAQTIDVDSTIKFIEHSNDVIREATLSSLNSLGIGGSGGAYALGKELSVSDAKKFLNHVESFMDIINGNTNFHSCLLEKITTCLGFDKKYTPEICIIDSIKEDRTTQINTLLTLVEKGILSTEEIGSKNKIAIMEDLGFYTDDLKD